MAMTTDDQVPANIVSDQQQGHLREIANRNVQFAAENGYVKFNHVSRTASVLSQMFRHVREQHGVDAWLSRAMIFLKDTEVTYDYSLGVNTLASSVYIDGWMLALAEICADSKIRHAAQHEIYREAVQALADGLTGNKEKALAFIGGVELAKEYTRE